MTRSRAAILVLLASAGLVGLNAIFLRVLEARAAGDGAAWDPSGDVLTVVLGVATTLVLALFGFFLGAFQARRASADRERVAKLSEALDYERGQRMTLSREKHEARQRIVALEERVRDLGRRPPPAPEPAPEPEPEPAPEPGPSEVEAISARAEAEQDELRGEIEDLRAQYQRLRSELGKRRERMADLMAELSVARTEAEEARAAAEELKDLPPSGAAPLERLEGQSIREVLETIVDLEGVSVALVADDEGLVVDSAGEVLQPDALAALSGVVAELSPQMGDLLPIGEITTVALGDAEGRVMELRYFPLFGASCALTIIRDEEHAYTEVARQAIETIVARLKD